MSEWIERIDEIDERSETVREILGTPPRWIIRWGISLLFVFVCILLGFSWIIKFPDVIPATAVITSQTPPVPIVAEVSAKIDQLLVSEGEWVEKDQLLLSLDNSAKNQDVLELEIWLNQLKDSLFLLGSAPFSSSSDLPNLGEIQASFASFEQQRNAVQFLLQVDPVQREIQSLRDQISALRSLANRLMEKEVLSQSEVELSQKDFQRNQQLFAEQVISEKSLEDKEREVLRNQGLLKESRLQLARTEVEIAGLQHQITERQNQQRQQYHQERIQLQARYEQLLGAIAMWKQRYLLSAPWSGKVSFFKFWSKQQFVQQNEEVLTILPETEQAIIGKLLMPVRNSGKVRLGQRVNIQLDNYPFSEFGMLTGKIQSISAVPREEQYAIEVSLDQGLQTSFGRQIPFRQEMSGSAEIITEDLRLIQRIFYQIRTIFHQP